MCCRNRKLPSLIRGQPGPEAARESLGGVLVSDRVGHHLPLHPERGVGQQVVEALTLMLVVVEAVAEADVAGGGALDQHVGAAGGVRLGVHLLAEYPQLGLRVEFAQIVLSDRQHPARAARRIQQRLHHARPGQQPVVVGEQQVHHQPDHLAGREVLARGLIRQLRELADQLLIEITPSPGSTPRQGSSRSQRTSTPPDTAGCGRRGGRSARPKLNLSTMSRADSEKPAM